VSTSTTAASAPVTVTATPSTSTGATGNDSDNEPEYASKHPRTGLPTEAARKEYTSVELLSKLNNGSGSDAEYPEITSTSPRLALRHTINSNSSSNSSTTDAVMADSEQLTDGAKGSSGTSSGSTGTAAVSLAPAAPTMITLSWLKPKAAVAAKPTLDSSKPLFGTAATAASTGTGITASAAASTATEDIKLSDKARKELSRAAKHVDKKVRCSYYMSAVTRLQLHLSRCK
jgi:hypothetical protein